MDDLFARVPSWLLRPLPVNAGIDAALHKRIDQLGSRLPRSLRELSEVLPQARKYREYDAAANRAAAHVWLSLESLYAADARTRTLLLIFAREHMNNHVLARVCRRLVKDPTLAMSNRARTALDAGGIREVALPLKPDQSWDQTGWLRGTVDVDLHRHHHGKRVLERHDLPEISTLSGLRKLLAIKSEKQLGWLLLASRQERIRGRSVSRRRCKRCVRGGRR